MGRNWNVLQADGRAQPYVSNVEHDVLNGDEDVSIVLQTDWTVDFDGRSSCARTLPCSTSAFMAAKKKTLAAGSTLPLQADPLPKQGAPQPPVGFTPPPKGQRRPGRLPTAQQVRDAGDVAGELTGSSTYGTDFSKRVPSAQVLSAALLLAQGWSAQVALAEEWLGYVRVECDAAWRGALQGMDDFAPEFKLAAKHDPAVAKRYPQTQDFLGVRAQAAQKGAKTRAKNAKKKAPPPSK